MVDDDRKAGTADKIKGNIKEQVGKLTGDSDKEAEGKAQKNKGKVQKKVGEAKEEVKDAFTDNDKQS